MVTLVPRLGPMGVSGLPLLGFVGLDGWKLTKTGEHSLSETESTVSIRPGRQAGRQAGAFRIVNSYVSYPPRLRPRRARESVFLPRTTVTKQPVRVVVHTVHTAKR